MTTLIRFLDVTKAYDRDLHDSLIHKMNRKVGIAHEYSAYRRIEGEAPQCAMLTFVLTHLFSRHASHRRPIYRYFGQIYRQHRHL